MEDYDYSNYSYNNNTPSEEPEIHNICVKDTLCVILVVVYVVIFLLGVSGNGLVIWIAGLKMKKTVNTTWYVSLAISDFIFCACIPFNITQMVTNEWFFGLFMCKFTSFVMFLNMFSSIFLLVVISIDRCMVVIFPVWAQNHRTLRRAHVVVFVSWVIAVAMSIPSLVFRQVDTEDNITICINNAPSNSHVTIAVSRFVIGFVLPFHIIILCYSVIIWRLWNKRMSRSSKPFKVMTALIATFLISWLPYHVFILQETFYFSSCVALQVSVALACANSCLNPFLYVLMGKDFKQKCWSSLLFKIENAFEEERSKGTSFSQADSKDSTNV